MSNIGELQTSKYEDLSAIEFSRMANEAKSKSHKKHRSLIEKLSKISEQTDAVLSRLQNEELKRNGDDQSND